MYDVLKINFSTATEMISFVFPSLKIFCGDCNSERGNFRNVVFHPRKTVSLNLDGSPGNWMIFFLFHPIYEERGKFTSKKCMLYLSFSTTLNFFKDTIYTRCLLN